MLWKRRLNLPPNTRQHLFLLGKILLTGMVFYLLLTHPTTAGDTTQPVWLALLSRAYDVHWAAGWPYLLLAAGIKAVGVGCAIWRWQILLQTQGLRFNWGHTASTFLIGRFLGTFLPGTLGLDGYKLYDARRYGGRLAEPLAATGVEKLLGLSGIMLTFLITVPWGYAVLGSSWRLILGLTVPLAASATLAIGWLLWRPAIFMPFLQGWAQRSPPPARRLLTRLIPATAVLQNRGRLLGQLTLLSFGVHATTASMYYFTALAVGAVQARYFEVVFASSIQILATVLSPLTVAGEGVREAVHALLLTRRLGAPDSILSAALGFWAAEALTLAGGFFWWRRRADYRPRVCEIT